MINTALTAQQTNLAWQRLQTVIGQIQFSEPCQMTNSHWQ